MGIGNWLANLLSGGRLRRIEEEYTLLDRRLDDLGWALLSKRTQVDETISGKPLALEAYNVGRALYRDNPLAAACCKITTTYVFGDGVAIPTCEDPRGQQIIREFWEDPDNQASAFAYTVQQELSDKLQWAGELFWILFRGENGLLRIAELDAAYVDSIVPSPDNPRRKLWYLVHVPGDNPAQVRKLAYPDWTLMPRVLGVRRTLETPVPDGYTLGKGYIYHLPVNQMGLRGISELWRIRAYARSVGMCAEAIPTMIRAQALFAWLINVRGSPQQAAAIKNWLMGQFFGQSSSDISLGSSAFMPSPGLGQVGVMTEGVTAQPGRISFGAAETAEGIRQLKLLVSAGMTIMEHYFGDASVGNLASTTSMEFPMLKKFQARQRLWKDVYDDWIKLALQLRLGENIPTWQSNFPPIVETDMLKIAQALQITRGQLRLISRRTAMRQVGVEDVERELRAIEEEDAVRADATEDAASDGRKTLDNILGDAVP